jgi:hypothetical protein
MRVPVRSLLLCLALLFCGNAAAQDLAARHEALLTAQSAAIEKSRAGVPELYLLAAGLSSKQDVFKNDVETMRDLFDKHWNTAGRSLTLIADDSTKESVAYPTRANLHRAAEAFTQKVNPQKDVFVLFLTSHGASKGLLATLPGNSTYTFSAVDVRKLLETAGARYRIVILSACHSGALMNELADDNTLVMTAAHASRSSFGCTFTHMHTWFTQALYEALAASPNFEQAFHEASKRIEQREAGGEAFEYSMPQIHVGRSVRAKLAEIERRATPAAGWAPPILATEAGKVRQLLGDYVAVSRIKGRDPEVRWLQLRKVGTPKDGTYPISAWAQIAYRSQGEFEATYDPATRVLTGNSNSLGNIRLSLQGQNLAGTAEQGATAPAKLEFENVLRREVFEVRAKNPPAKMRAKASSVVRLVYLSADDCSDCRKWERDHLQDGRLTNMPEFRQIEFVTANRNSHKSRLRKGDLPDSVAHLFDKFEAEKGYARILTTVPSFALLVDDQVRMWTTGTFLDSPIYPVLRAAVHEKTGSGN